MEEFDRQRAHVFSTDDNNLLNLLNRIFLVTFFFFYLPNKLVGCLAALNTQKSIG